MERGCQQNDGTLVDGAGKTVIHPRGKLAYEDAQRVIDGHSSRRRDCHLMAPPYTFGWVFFGMNRGCNQNDSLADGY